MLRLRFRFSITTYVQQNYVLRVRVICVCCLQYYITTYVHRNHVLRVRVICVCCLQYYSTTYVHRNHVLRVRVICVCCLQYYSTTYVHRNHVLMVSVHIGCAVVLQTTQKVLLLCTPCFYFSRFNVFNKTHLNRYVDLGGSADHGIRALCKSYVGLPHMINLMMEWLRLAG